MKCSDNIFFDVSDVDLRLENSTSTNSGGDDSSTTGNETPDDTNDDTPPNSVVSPEGTGLITVTTNETGASVTKLAVVDEAAPLPQELVNTKPTDVTFPHGFISYSITGVSPGGTITIDITFPSIPDSPLFYKVDSTRGYTEFTAFVINGNTATITLTDGGVGDADGIVNGVIDDPIGIGSRNTATTTTTTTVTSSGGSIDPIGILILLMLLFLQASRKGERGEK